MEVYYKDLISEDASLERLIDELMLMVQGAEELAQTWEATAAEPGTEDSHSGLERLKIRYQGAQRQAVAGALAFDRVLRRHPYSTAGFAFAVGLLAARFLQRRQDR